MSFGGGRRRLESSESTAEAAQNGFLCHCLGGFCFSLDSLDPGVGSFGCGCAFPGFCGCFFSACPCGLCVGVANCCDCFSVHPFAVPLPLPFPNPHPLWVFLTQNPHRRANRGCRPNAGDLRAIRGLVVQGISRTLLRRDRAKQWLEQASENIPLNTPKMIVSQKGTMTISVDVKGLSCI